jgi:uncharacterized NAD(P)/FAD-binding protein YdhS
MEAHSDRAPKTFTIAVIGGGFTGTTLAAQLLRHTDPSFSVVVIEKAGLPGRGLAYGTDCDSHLLNVPAIDMSAFPEDREHFLRWAKSSYDWDVEPCSFLPRKQYGRYLGDIFGGTVLSGGKRRLRWKKDEAFAISQSASGETEIRLRSGSSVLANKVVLALGNFPSSGPSLPGQSPAGLSRTASDSHSSSPHSDVYFPNPWSDEALEGVEHLDSILLLGSGLSSLDIALKLRHRGFSGTIHILSRHGLLPHSHQPHSPWPIFWNQRSPRSVRGLLKLVREQVRKAERQGGDWRSVVNCLRPVTSRIWQSLPQAEKRRFLRHVRPYWEVHRHRAAPETAKFIDEQRSNGKIEIHAGRIIDCKEIDSNKKDAGVEITYRERKGGEEHHLTVGRIINCTATETDCRSVRDSLVSSLLAQGLARPDPLFLGLDTSATGALIDHEGMISDSLYTVGPLRKGSLWESTAVPEIREQVYQLVQLIGTNKSTHNSCLISDIKESADATHAAKFETIAP